MVSIKKKQIVFLMLVTAFFLSSKTYAQLTEAKRDFVLLIYMNGSDLESKYELASQNIKQIIGAYKNKEDNFAIVILHGGTKKWHFSPSIPADSITYSKITRQGFEKIQTIENSSIGNPTTLTEFISFNKKYFPAERYGLIFWNHGRGSVHGFGYDELFPDDISLSLKEMREAFSVLKQSQNDLPFDFIGFDACLMATIETASTLAPYSNYLVASQELEPGGGWNYEYIIQTLSENPVIKTADLLKGIVNSYINSYAEQQFMQTTLSVIALDKMDSLNASIGKLIGHLSTKLNSTLSPQESFKEKSSYRSKSKSFGLPSFSHAAEDMIDLRSFFASAFSNADSLFRDFEKQLHTAVRYNGYSRSLQNDQVSGLSVYFPYYNKRTAANLEDYFSVQLNTEFKKFMEAYVFELINGRADDVFVKDLNRKLNAEMLLHTNKIYLNIRRMEEGKAMTSFGLDGYDVNVDADGYITLYGTNENWDGRWITLNEVPICVFMGLSDETSTLYTVPVQWNEKSAELLIRYMNVKDEVQAKVIGVREISEEGITDKIKELQQADELVFLAQNVSDHELNVELGRLTVVNQELLEIKLLPMPAGKYQVGFCMVDFYGNRHYTTFQDYLVH